MKAIVISEKRLRRIRDEVVASTQLQVMMQPVGGMLSKPEDRMIFISLLNEVTEKLLAKIIEDE